MKQCKCHCKLASFTGGIYFKITIWPLHNTYMHFRPIWFRLYVIFLLTHWIKIKVCTRMPSWLFHFNYILMTYRAKIMKVVSVSKYTAYGPNCRLLYCIWTTLSVSEIWFSRLQLCYKKIKVIKSTFMVFFCLRLLSKREYIIKTCGDNSEL